jgi:methionyl-tRNA synthetase
MINKYQNGVIGPIPNAHHDVNNYHEAMSNCRLDRAVEAVWEQVRGINQFIEEEKPWMIAKSGDTENLQEVLAEAAGSLMEIADLLVPFMPDTATKIKNIFVDGIVKPLEGASLFPRFEESKPA